MTELEFDKELLRGLRKSFTVIHCIYLYYDCCIGGMLRVKVEKSRKPQIDLQDDDFGAILNCSVRYSLGRMTYMPGLVMGFIRPLLPYVTNRTLWCFDRDISSAYSLGDPNIDAPKWKEFHQQIKSEMDKRGMA